MAADLVFSPVTAHTFVHDIESAFWVLLWAVFAHMPTSWTAGARSSFLKDTMSPRVFMGSGGSNKKFFITSHEAFSGVTIGQPENSILRDFLSSLRSLLAIRHELPPSPPSVFDPIHIQATLRKETEGTLSEEAATTVVSHSQVMNQPIERYEAMKDMLKDHWIVIAMFRMALDTHGWPEDDHTVCQHIVPSNDVETAMHSSLKRLWDVAKGSGMSVWPQKQSEPACA